MLLIADKTRTGIVDMPVERLAARAGLSLPQTLEGLALLSAPDKESRSDLEEGRRLVPIRDDPSRGWRLVNYDEYAAIIRAEQEREQTRARVAAFRDRQRAKGDGLRDEPEMERARKLLNEAVARGRIIRPSMCSRCGGSGVGDRMAAIEGHHCDYAKPLEVVWLCSKCHKAAHDVTPSNAEKRSGNGVFE